VRLAEEFDDGARTVADFVSDLRARFMSEGEGRGINLLTLHRAKGLEFEAVFIVRLDEGEIPFKRAMSDEAVAEERRLVYVGLTRAKRHLVITTIAAHKPSRFLSELGREHHVARDTLPDARRRAAGRDDPVLASLKRWRRERARADAVPPYVVFHDTTLAEIARIRPRSLVQLSEVHGVGPTKIARYGKEVLAAVTKAGSR
jgi:DNA helicase-2/ATP-dependent DNA helicase PcrA